MKVLLIASAGFNNFGDEAMFEVEYERLKKEYNNVTVGVIDIKRAKKRYPNITFMQIPIDVNKVSFITMKIKNKYFNTGITSFDKLFVAGGGNLNSFYYNYLESIYGIVLAYKKMNKYVEFRPQSVGPFFGKRHFIAEYIVKDIVKKVDKFLVREKISYDFLQRTSDKIELQHDDAWNLKINKIDGIEEKLGEGRFIGISIRPWEVNTEYLINWFIELCDKLNKMGYKPVFIPICYNKEAERYCDNIFMKPYLKNNAIFLDDIIEIEKLNPENIKYCVSLCEANIGLSYHFNVFSLSLNKKTISLYYEDYYKVKNLGLQSAFGNRNSVINPFEKDTDYVIKLLSY